MNKKRRIIWISIAVSVIVLALIFFIMSESGNGEIKSHLLLGNKYLEEMDYEQALVEYRAVLEQSPNNQTALTGIENVCTQYADSLLMDAENVTMERFNSLRVILEEGYQLTEYTSIQDKINQVIKVITDKEVEKKKEAEEEEFWRGVEEERTWEEEYEEWQEKIDAEVKKIEDIYFIILEWAFKEQIFKSEWNWVFWSNVETMTIISTEGKDSYEVEIKGGPSQLEYFVYEISKKTLQGHLVKYFAEDFQGGFTDEKDYTDKPAIDFAKYTGEIEDTELLMQYEIIVQDVNENVVRNKKLWRNSDFGKYKYLWQEFDENERVISRYERCEFTDKNIEGWMLEEYEYTEAGERKITHYVEFDSEMNVMEEWEY